MSLCPETLARAASRGPFVRVLVADVRGSAPREAGTGMFVWPDTTEGTIGGGRLEFEAIAKARALAAPRLERIALGPALGQCCGGAVTLAYEPWDKAAVAALAGPVHARRIEGPEAMPLSVSRALARARDRGAAPPPLLDGWLLEEVAPAPVPVWIWGAGHVGRAIVSVLAPLPGLALRWADTGAGRFPDPPHGAVPLVAENPADLVPLAPVHAHHLVLSYSHALDLELCHRLLGRGFASLGLIGSATKAARFRARLRALGHSDATIARITCPIGEPSLGKHPQAIAVGVAAALLRELSAAAEPAAPTAKGCAG